MLNVAWFLEFERQKQHLKFNPSEFWQLLPITADKASFMHMYYPERRNMCIKNNRISDFGALEEAILCKSAAFTEY